MGSFSKQSLEELRSRIDLIEVIGPHVSLQKSGAAYKALCPFHEEKSPSFIVQKGDQHYHCFGCGAHGDAIQFLMTHLRMGFIDAVTTLAERFQVRLEEVENEQKQKGPSKPLLKEALEKATQFYHFFLLHTHEGHVALDYLYNRGIDLEFIQKFRIGLAPKRGGVFLKAMRELKIADSVLEEAGLFSKGREFFQERITIPIGDAAGAVIGFSARKYVESTFGGKYINTPETVLFKKSKVLFGLSYSRKTIAKEKRALIVEGQIDALKLVHAGFAWTVAGQGTAFGEDHVKELMHLGLRQVYLAFDGDTAGQEAAMKVGHLFSKEGTEVFVVSLPEKQDPDLVLRELGPDAWEKMVQSSPDYLSFLVAHLSKSINANTPAGKNDLVMQIAKRIRDWDHPLMIHESLRKLARITGTPESIVGAPLENSPQIYVKRSASVTFTEIDPDRILEADILRWLLIAGSQNPKLFDLAAKNVTSSHFRIQSAKAIYEKLMGNPDHSSDFLKLAIDLESPDHQLFMAEVLQKRVNRERSETCLIEAMQRLLERNWMHEREEIKLKIYSGGCTEAEVLELARKFDLLKRDRPQVIGI